LGATAQTFHPLAKVAVELRSLGTIAVHSRSHGMAKPLQHQIIAGALELIADEAHWTRGALARDKRGLVCCWESREAFRFCAVGALARAAADLLGSASDAGPLALAIARDVMIADGVTRCVQQINDIEGHAAVVRALQKALE
jgi:hypothetical protein